MSSTFRLLRQVLVAWRSLWEEKTVQLFPLDWVSMACFSKTGSGTAVPRDIERQKRIKHWVLADRAGIPSALAFLHAMRWKDPELQELFLTQGFLVAEESNDIYLARVLEAWSRTCAKDPEVTDRMEQLAEQICAPESNKHTELAHDMRDALNVLATLMRSSPESKLISQLEAHLSSKLRGASYAEAMLTLQWMQRLALRSAELWEACAEVVELGLKEKTFVRDHFADAVHCLASLSASQGEAALIFKLISSAEVERAASRQTAEKTLRVLHAASIIQLEDSILDSWGSKASRLARQMSLPDRRILRMISDAKPKASAQLTETMAKMCLKFRFMMHDAWENALFVHWPVPPERLAEMLPRRGLEPDIMDGSAWVGLVLLTERGVSSSHPLGRVLVPPIDHLGANIRDFSALEGSDFIGCRYLEQGTYVRRSGVPGIFFWSLECSSTLASIGARAAGIPYFPASMSRSVDFEPFAKNKNVDMQKAEPGFTFEFSSTRCGMFSTPRVSARWHLQSGNASEHDGLCDTENNFTRRARWFVERYSVYAAWPWGKGPLLLRGDVQHPQWPLQRAVIESLDASELLQAAGWTELASGQNLAPHVCFSRGVGPVEPIAPLPPLCTSAESENLKIVQKGSDAVLQAKKGDEKCIKYMGFGDALAGEISLSCRLSVRALEQQGLTVELRGNIPSSDILKLSASLPTMPPQSKAASKRPPAQALPKKRNAKKGAISAKKLRELEQVRKVKEPFLDMFVEALTKGDPDPSELAWHLSWRCSNPRRYDAPAACSLMLFSEALPGHVNLCDVLEAIDYHQAIRKHIGDDRWEERRVHADELLQKLHGAKVSPRSFSLLHRAVSVACAKKDGPSEELKALSSATSKAVCDKDPEACKNLFVV
eukprot:s935_g38.t1